MNGGMSEAQTHSAELKDVGPDTFIRFLEYAYRCDYTAPSWTQDMASGGNGMRNSDISVKPSPGSYIIAPHISQATHVSSGISTSWTAWGNSRSAPSAFSAIPSAAEPEEPEAPLIPEVSGKIQPPSRAAFNNREYKHPACNSRAQDDTRPTTSSPQDVTSVLLAHAQIYTLADMRMVQPLKDLALHKLHKILVGLKLHAERLDDVVELARYAYGHGEDRSDDGRIDALRDLVVNYIACEMKVLGKHAEFRDLMDGGGEFAGDFWDIVSQELL